VPVIAGDKVVGCINMTWLVSALDLQTAVSRYLPDVQAAAQAIGKRVDARLSLAGALLQ
jgi:hypothetical protein